jgi:hypothetical protein
MLVVVAEADKLLTQDRVDWAVAVLAELTILTAQLEL